MTIAYLEGVTDHRLGRRIQVSGNALSDGGLEGGQRLTQRLVGALQCVRVDRFGSAGRGSYLAALGTQLPPA